MKIGTPYKRARLDDHYDSIVIGSGMGGLTTASLLARHAQQRVLVLEQHYTAGGFTHSFERPGFDWDVGVHYLGEVNRKGRIVRWLFDHLSDGELAWADMGEVYDRVRIGERSFDFVKGGRKLRASLTEAFPHERAGIERYFALVRQVNRDSQPYFADKVLPGSLSRVVGPALRSFVLRHARRTTADVVHELVRDPELRGILTAQWGDYGLPPAQSSFLIHALVAGHYWGGAAYPVGGASRIAATIVPSIERAGGAVVVRADVARIALQNERAVGVELADGRRITSDRVISNAGAALTFGKLLPGGEEQSPAAGLRASVAHLSLYVGLEGDAEALALPKHNIWVYPNADHDGNFARMLRDDDAPLPVAFLSFAAGRDPDFARRHPGHATAEVVTFAPGRWFTSHADTRWGKRGADYDALKARLSDRLLETLFRELPQLRGKVIHRELSTPLSTRHFAAHPEGEIYGLAHDPARFERASLRPETHVPGLYLTGSDVVTCGVAGALMGGVLCAAAVLRRDLLALIRPRGRKALIPRAERPTTRHEENLDREPSGPDVPRL